MNDFILRKKLKKNIAIAIILILSEIALIVLFAMFYNDKDNYIFRNFQINIPFYVIVAFPPFLLFKIVELISSIVFMVRTIKNKQTLISIFYGIGIFLSIFYLVANFIFIHKLNSYSNKLNQEDIKIDDINNQYTNNEITYICASHKSDKLKQFRERLNKNNKDSKNNDETNG